MIPTHLGVRKHGITRDIQAAVRFTLLWSRTRSQPPPSNDEAWKDADLEAAKPALLVRRTLTRGEDGRGWVVGASTKSGKGRRVRLTRPAVAALKDHRKRHS